MRFARTSVLALTATTSVFVATTSDPVSAEPATDLIFSEYIEGSSNNKALEIYNGTVDSVDLTGYTITQHSNGSTGTSATLSLSGTLAVGDVYVIGHGSANAAITSVADQITTVGLFNGDDALVLRHDGAVVDSIGQVGVDPGTEWGTGLTSTADNTLRRKSSVCAGDTNPDDAFDPATGWDGFAQDTFDGLGAHTSDCVTVTEQTPVINEFSASTTGDDVEYIELFAAPDTDLSNLTVLEIEGDGTGAGTIDEVVALGTADSSGFLLVDLPTNSLENGTITLLLVDGFTGAAGDDLDTDNDGVFDSTPWTSIDDGVAVHDGGSADRAYAIALGPNYDGVSSFPPGGASRIPDGADTDTTADWVRNDFDLAGIPGVSGTPTIGEAFNTPGAPNQIVTKNPPVEVAIHVVQGDGAASPFVGEDVIIDGVVVGDYQHGGSFGGFQVQEPDADADADPATSEGVFVFHDAIDVAIGDSVRVTGTVQEFFGLTEITSATVEVLSSANPLPTPTTIQFPVDAIADLEAYESMLATFPQGLVVSEYFNFDRFGELVIALPAEGEDRPFIPTAIFDPESQDALDRLDLNLRSRITVDDAQTGQNPAVQINPFNGEPFDLDNDFRGGDVVTGLTGVIHFDFGLYRILPYPDAFDSYVATERPAAPSEVGGSLRLASLNALNYFLTLDDGVNDVCGPDQNLECRGADTTEELERQRVKLINTLAGLDADIIGMNEVENRPGVEPLADLAAGLNDRLGAGTYDYIAAGENSVVGSDAIKVGILYKPDAVLPIGDTVVLDDAAFVNPFDAEIDRNRAAVAASFVDLSNGGVVSVVVNHLKSKGSGCGPGDDHPLAGNCNATRTAAAQYLANWVTTDPTGIGDSDWMILGDLNSYDKEAPIDVLTDAGFTDLQFQYGGEHAYSFVFDGQFGYLDYTMSNASLTPQVTGATEWHINADESDVFDYDTTFKSDYQDALFDPTTPYRSSDHDAALAGAALRTDADVVIAWVHGEIDALEGAGSLNQGQANAIRRSLDQALDQLERGHIDGAIGILGGVSSQLSDLVADGVLTADEAGPLILAVDAVRAGLTS